MAAILSLPNLHPDPIRSLVECTVESFARSLMPYLQEGYRIKYYPYPAYDGDAVLKKIMSEPGILSEIGCAGLPKAQLVLASDQLDEIDGIVKQPLLTVADTAWVRLLTMYTRGSTVTPILKMSEYLGDPENRKSNLVSFCLPLGLLNKTTKQEIIINIGFDELVFHFFLGLKVPWFCPPRERYTQDFIASKVTQNDVSRIIESKTPNADILGKVCTPAHFEALIATS